MEIIGHYWDQDTVSKVIDLLPPNTHFKRREVSNPLGVSLGASYESRTQCQLDSQLLCLSSTPNEAKGGRPYQTMFGEFIKF